MSGKSLSTGIKPNSELASLRSGQDWARWLAQEHPAQPSGSLRRSGGQLPASAWTTLVHLARREGFADARGDCAEGDTFTSWRDRRIHIRRDAAPAQAITALAHQLGHVLLHGEIAYLDRSGTVPCHGIRKVEADSIAVLVAIHLGIDGPAITFPHISSWAGTDPRAHPVETVQAVASRVLTAAAVITAHLDAALPDAGPATQPVHAPGATEPEPPARVHARAAAADAVGTPSLTAPGGELAQVHQTAARFFGWPAAR